jgi:hypothetical protein
MITRLQIVATRLVSGVMQMPDVLKVVHRQQAGVLASPLRVTI